MKADKIISQLMSHRKETFQRLMLWEQVKFLETIMAKWDQLKQTSPRQQHLWSRKFWEMADWFCDGLTVYMDAYQAKLLKTTRRQPANFPRFLNKLYEFDSDRVSELMMRWPLAFSIVEQEWTLWARIVV